jgi:hypothetical protein
MRRRAKRTIEPNNSRDSINSVDRELADLGRQMRQAIARRDHQRRNAARLHGTQRSVRWA